MSNTTSLAILNDLIKERYIKRSGQTDYLIKADLAHEVILASGDRFYILSDAGDDYHGQHVLAVRPDYFNGGFYRHPIALEIKGDERSFAVLTSLDDIQLLIMLNQAETLALVGEMEGDVFPKPLDTKTLTGVTSISLSRFQVKSA